MAFTFFFRDSQTLEIALDALVPQLLGRAFIHIWDAGCAHGPEPYTLAILLRDRLSSVLFRNVRIHATDLERDFASQVTAGVFPEAQVQRIPDAYRQAYFRPADRPGCVQVTEELRTRISFEVHDLLSLQPIRRDFSLIVCKNVLLHFEEPTRCQVLQMFYESLLPGGVLALEHTQKLPDQMASLFGPVTGHAQVFRRLDAPGENSPHPRRPHSSMSRGVKEFGSRKV